MITEDRKTGFAHFRADIIWALQPFAEYVSRTDQIRFLDGNIIVEPCVDGGAIIVAVTGHAMAVFRDPDGYCSGAMTLALPDDLFRACKTPDPIAFNYCGTPYECALPEWAVPGSLYAYSAGVHLSPKMRHHDWADEDDEFHPCLWSSVECGNNHHIGIDYKWTDGCRLNWRVPLAKASKADSRLADNIAVSPEVIGLFDRCQKHFLVPENPRRIFHRATAGKESTVLVTIEGVTDFVGCYMPMREGSYQPAPEWFQKKVQDAPTKVRQ